MHFLPSVFLPPRYSTRNFSCHFATPFSFLYSHSAATSDSSTLAILKKNRKILRNKTVNQYSEYSGFLAVDPGLFGIRQKKKYSDSIFGFPNFNIRIRLRSAEYSVFGSNTRIQIDIPGLASKHSSTCFSQSLPKPVFWWSF